MSGMKCLIISNSVLVEATKHDYITRYGTTLQHLQLQAGDQGQMRPRVPPALVCQGGEAHAGLGALQPDA